uniref:acetylcholinesterase n=1 Tax=Dermatophagoides pteronyssinus TaxID=6956 RepID=A0A6P6Y102_DERPT|nr:acetylcholinesterase-like [Dermatophagoides pteronyssinus]
MSKIYNKSIIGLTVVNAILLVIIYVLYYGKPNSLTDGKRTKLNVNKIIVETESGKISGFNEKIDGDQIRVFLGIPYADAPIGELRFQPPKSKQQWNETIDANHWPNPCMQPDQSLQLNNYNFSEDCLYLNIWSPVSNDSLKPVIVVIHTGAFIFGSASEFKYNGLFLAHHAEVVVVTFNYRLNFYGFFYRLNMTNIIPNVGMLDQVEALKWIHKYIRYFGGDASRITLVGQSSAALSVGMHILSPLSQGLFSQAILMSGSPLQINEMNDPEQVTKFWSNYLRYMNCNNAENIIDCVDSKIVKNRSRLVSMEMVKQLAEDKLFVNIPIMIDGHFQPNNPIKLLENLSNMNLSILYGYTNDEGSWIAMLEDREYFGTQIRLHMQSLYQAMRTAEIFLNKMFTSLPINKTKIIDYYFNPLLKIHNTEMATADTNILHRIITNMLGDRYIVCPMENFIDSLLATKKSSIYQYYWQYKGSHRTSSFWNTFQRVWCGDWMGSCHSFEMFAMFGIPFLQPTLFDHSDRLVSMELIQMIKYFIHKRRLPWPLLDSNQKIFYNLDSDNEKYIFGNNFKNYDCKNTWNNFYQSKSN